MSESAQQREPDRNVDGEPGRPARHSEGLGRLASDWQSTGWTPTCRCGPGWPTCSRSTPAYGCTCSGVELDVDGVHAEAQLRVRLEQLAGILGRALDTLDNNPQIIEALARIGRRRHRRREPRCPTVDRRGQRRSARRHSTPRRTRRAGPAGRRGQPGSRPRRPGSDRPGPDRPGTAGRVRSAGYLVGGFCRPDARSARGRAGLGRDRGPGDQGSNRSGQQPHRAGQQSGRQAGQGGSGPRRSQPGRQPRPPLGAATPRGRRQASGPRGRVTPGGGPKAG